MIPALLGRLHHIGFVVGSIEQALPGFLKSLDSKTVTEIFHDPLQKARVVFVRTAAEEPVLIELVEPDAGDSPQRRFLEKGGGLNHLCYEVPDLEGALREMKRRKAVIVSTPKPAVAFGGRRVGWAMTREWLLIELLEAGLAADAPDGR